MCDPISLGIGLTLAGSAAQYIGNQQAKRATLNAFNTEQVRQKAKTADQQKLLDNSYDTAGKLNDPNAQQAAVDKRKSAFIQALNARPADSGYLPGTDSAPKVVADASAKATADQDAFSGQQADALARMTGLGDQLFDTNIQLGRNSQGIGQLGVDKAQSAAALNAELNAARFKGGTLRGFGGLAQMIGAAALGGGFGSKGSLNSVLNSKSGYFPMAGSVSMGPIDFPTVNLPPVG